MAIQTFLPRRVLVALLALIAVGITAYAPSALALPPGVHCVAATPANEVTPPPPMWQLKHEPPPANPPQPLCPTGSVPAAIPLAHPTDSPPSAPVAAKPKPHSLARPKPASEGFGEPASETTGGLGEVSPFVEKTGYPTAPFYYAGDGYHTPEKWYGISAGIQTGNPKISSAAGTHSLGQIASATPNVEYTVEMGWHRDEAFGSGPRLFIYINKDHYKSNGEPGGDCYNCVTPIVGATYTQNQELAVGKTYQFSTAYGQGKWWFGVGSNWIAYEPESFWSNKFTSATWLPMWGEVYDTTGPTSQMGNGIIGTTTGSLVMNNPYLYFEGGNSLFTTAGHRNWKTTENPYPSDVPGYSVGLYSTNAREWHYGGE